MRGQHSCNSRAKPDEAVNHHLITRDQVWHCFGEKMDECGVAHGPEAMMSPSIAFHDSLSRNHRPPATLLHHNLRHLKKTCAEDYPQRYPTRIKTRQARHRHVQKSSSSNSSSSTRTSRPSAWVGCQTECRIAIARSRTRCISARAATVSRER